LSKDIGGVLVSVRYTKSVKSTSKAQKTFFMKGKTIPINELDLIASSSTLPTDESEGLTARFGKRQGL
jgi:hypothetical protein